jgi:uncharacterized membrane protein YhaH (DUF805 family)
LTIARQEIAQRWFMLAAALALGLVPLLIAWIGGCEELSRYGDTYDGNCHGDYQGLASIVQLGLLMISYVAAFAIGMGVLGRPLHDGGIAFYFARPVGAVAIVVGKVAGALVLVVGVESLLFLRNVGSTADDRLTNNVPFAILVGAGFLGAGLVLGILARSKSRWFMLDAIGAIVVTFEFTQLLDRINIAEMRFRFSTYEKARPLFEQVSSVLTGMLAAAIAATFVAAGAAIAIGRIDQERAHRVLSIVLWSLLIAIGGIGFSIGQWGLR